MSKVQKTVVSVDLLCSKCKKKTIKSVAGLEGINSIAADSSKNTLTVTGEADPVQIIKKVRKVRCSANFVSIGPPPAPPKVEEKKDEKTSTTGTVVPNFPRTCQKCEVWYVVGEDYPYCSIL